MKHKKLNKDLELFFSRCIWCLDMVLILLVVFVWTIPAVYATDNPARHIESMPSESPEQPKIDLVIIDTMDLPQGDQKLEIEAAGASERVFSEDDLCLMAKVVRAEAGNQDELGKRLVVDVILNRLDSDIFPDSVSGVVYQQGQFKVWDYFTEEDLAAVIAEIEDRTDLEILFFRRGYFHSFGYPAYQHGDHYFSTL